MSCLVTLLVFLDELDDRFFNEIHPLVNLNNLNPKKICPCAKISSISGRYCYLFNLAFASSRLGLKWKLTFNFAVPMATSG
jgi:hypothetical protein